MHIKKKVLYAMNTSEIETIIFGVYMTIIKNCNETLTKKKIKIKVKLNNMTQLPIGIPRQS